MTFIKRTLILSDVKNGVGTGIIRLTVDGGETCASVRLLGIDSKNATLVLRAENRILAYPAENNSVLSLPIFDLNLPVDCVVVDGKNKPLLVGTTGRDKYKCFNLADEYVRQISQKTDLDNSADFAPESSVDKDNFTSENVDVQPEVLSEKSETPFILSEGVEYGGDNFYLAVKPQLDEMFICYPPENSLMDIVPNSKWVHVSTTDDYYVVGVIFELDEPQYICYGIPGVFAVKPPESVKNICDWLPLDLEKPEGGGYWLIYQSAKTGETLKRR